MKKKSQSFSQDFKMPYLFREDLESIENILKELSPQECTFETKDFEYKTIQEIPEDIIVTHFHIQTYNPYINLEFSENNARIYEAIDDIKTIGAVKKITDIISKRQRKLLWYLSSLSTWLAPIFFFVPIQLLLINLGEKEVNLNKKWLIIMPFISIFSVIWWIVGYYSNLKKFSVIEFAYRKNKSKFFIKNKDQIIVGIIVAIATVLLTLLFQKIFK